MKILKRTGVLLMAILAVSSSYAEDSDSLNKIGDNLDLHAVLDAFKNSESLESFEKTINDNNSKINNLDLNEDGEVDYIQVIDNAEDDAHAIILRIDLDENESQDVAAFEIEKSGDATVNIQIVGDEEIYGSDYYVEPIQEKSSSDHLLVRPSAVILVNVWHWPSIRYIYGPKYVRWVSPYRWRKYPNYWRAWKPYKWNTYHNFHKHHYRHYRVVHVRHGHRAHKIYHKHRRTSVKIKNHHKYHSKKAHPANKSNGHHKGAQKTTKGSNTKGNGHATTPKQKSNRKKKSTASKKSQSSKGKSHKRR